MRSWTEENQLWRAAGMARRHCHRRVSLAKCIKRKLHPANRQVGGSFKNIEGNEDQS